MDNETLQPENDLLDAAIAAARQLGLQIDIVQREPMLGRARADALIRIERAGEEALYAVEVKRRLTPATLGAALHQLDRFGQQALLVTEYVTPPLADELKARRTAFLDAAGNAYLDQPRTLVWVNGRKPAVKPMAFERGRAFQPTGLQVLFALLCDPAAVNLPYRELATMAGVAHGTVGWVMPDLQRHGFIADLGGKRGTRKLFNATRLLTQWTDAYIRDLRPRTILGRYYVPTIQDWKTWPIAEHGALWGGEPAAALLTDYLRPGELVLYADKIPGTLAAKQKFAQHTEPGRTAVVEVRRKFWNFRTDAPRHDIVPPVLVYADLLATGDGRCLETAKMVYDAHVARLLEER